MFSKNSVGVAVRYLGVLALMVQVVPINAQISKAPLEVSVQEILPSTVETIRNQSSEQNLSTFQDGFFKFKGNNLHYVEAGKGETILFIHGFPSNWVTFIRQMEALKNDYHVVAIDGLGAGLSDAPQDLNAYKLEAMGEHLDALIDSLGIEKVHLVGHDWGSSFALAFAQRYPDRVRSVTGLSVPAASVVLELLAGNASHRRLFSYINILKRSTPLRLRLLRVPSITWRTTFKPFVDDGILSNEEGELIRQVILDSDRYNSHINWYRANIPAFDQIKNSDFWPTRKARLSMPVSFLWGTDDPLATPELIDELKEVSDNIRLQPLTGVGHWPTLEEADTVTNSIRALLSE